MVRKCSYAALVILGLLVVLTGQVFAQATVDFTFEPATPSLNALVTFTVIVSGDPDWFVSYAWDFDQDGVSDASGVTVTHSFPTEGTYPVTMTATDSRHELTTVTNNVEVVNAPPSASFTYSPAFPDAAEVVSFDGQGSSDSDGRIVTYEWDFDSDTVIDDTGIRVRYAFSTAGQHPVTLKVTDDGDATDTEMKWISVQTVPPVVNFTYSPSSPTVNNVIQFQDTSEDPDGGQIVAWNWSFGDAGTSASENPTHQYASGGEYTVTLRVADDDQETGALVQTVTVLGPTAAFSFTPTSPTATKQVQFFDQSSDPTGNIISWSWDFGDTGVSSDQNPIHTFATSGTFRVNLTVSSSSGATVSTFRDITVQNAAPIAGFVFDPPQPKVGEMVTFGVDGSSDPDGSIVMYEWDFNNDGVTDVTGSTVTYAFSVVGAQPVTLKVTDNNSASDYLTKVVPVQATPPSASFTFTPEEPNTGQTVTFDGSASADVDGGIILYEWDFDNDGTTDATGMTVNHSFPSAGVYPVTLIVTDNDGAFDAETQGVPVQAGGTGGDNQPPVADFAFEPAEGPDVNLNEVVTFQADGCSDPDGTVDAYEWDFDRDGVYDATGTKVSHAFHTGGAKIVTLCVTDNDGAFGFKTRVVSVEFIRPTADFTYAPDEPKVGTVVSFDGSGSTDRDGRVDFYEWDFDNDGRADATGMTVNHVFNDGGGQPVTLKVTDNDGVTDFITKTLPVRINTPPISSFTVEPTHPTTDDTVVFTSTSTDSDGSVVSWNWDFGNGDTDSTQTPSHTFATVGTYAVTLIVTDNEGATGTTTEDVTATAPTNAAPVASFTFSPSIPQVGSSVQFTDASTDANGTVTAWSWDFGDGGTSTTKSPTHTYTAAGTYVVSLTVTDNDGARSSSTTEQVAVGEPGTNLILHSYPNPASRQASIVYYLPTGATDPVLRIYNITGALVFEQELTVGESPYVWDLTSTGGTAQPNGLYLCIVVAKDNGSTIKSPIFKLLIAR